MLFQYQLFICSPTIRTRKHKMSHVSYEYDFKGSYSSYSSPRPTTNGTASRRNVSSSTSIPHVSQSRSRRLGNSNPLLYFPNGRQQPSRINSRRIVAPQVRNVFNNNTLESSSQSTGSQKNKTYIMAWVQRRKEAILANVASIDDLEVDMIEELSMLIDAPLILGKFHVS